MEGMVTSFQQSRGDAWCRWWTRWIFTFRFDALKEGGGGFVVAAFFAGQFRFGRDELGKKYALREVLRPPLAGIRRHHLNPIDPGRALQQPEVGYKLQLPVAVPCFNSKTFHQLTAPARLSSSLAS